MDDTNIPSNADLLQAARARRERAAQELLQALQLSLICGEDVAEMRDDLDALDRGCRQVIEIGRSS